MNPHDLSGPANHIVVSKMTAELLSLSCLVSVETDTKILISATAAAQQQYKHQLLLSPWIHLSDFAQDDQKAL